MIRQIIQTLIIVSFCLYLSACKSETKPDKTQLLLDTLTVENNMGKMDVIVLPSAELIFDLQNLDIQLKSDNIHSTDFVENYQSILSKSLNLGIYVTDFTYLTSVDKTYQLNEYLNVINTLSNELKISNVYTEEVMNNYMQNLHQQDSLYIYILETYNSFVNSLQSSNRTPLLLTISVGALVELLYLISDNVNSQEEFNKIQTDMKNYSFILDEYLKHTKLYLTDPLVKKIIPDLDLLHSILKINELSSKQKKIYRKGSSIYISSEGISEMEYSNFILIKDMIQSIRQKYITLK
jgi:hypothetical protein